MTALEFQAWLAGIASALDGRPPSKDLWDEIVAKARCIQPPTPMLPPAPLLWPPVIHPIPFEVTC